VNFTVIPCLQNYVLPELPKKLSGTNTSGGIIKNHIAAETQTKKWEFHS
jgi:hypothetical protein